VLGVARIYQTLQQQRSGDESAPPYAVPFITSVPTLTEMTMAALNVLDNDRDGFFLMVEGGAVDWAAHSNQTGRMLEEQIAFDETVAAVTEWVETHSSWRETLVIVTSDHETGYLTGPGSGPLESGDLEGGSSSWFPLVNRGRGVVPGLQWNIKGHTNSLVPFFARGSGSRWFEAEADKIDPVRGAYLDNTEIGRVLFSFFGEDSGASGRPRSEGNPPSP
jgi:alkaline phosphatase